jgi:hypothetical protein
MVYEVLMAKKQENESYSAKESEQRFKAALLGSRLAKSKPAKQKAKKKKATA